MKARTYINDIFVDTLNISKSSEMGERSVRVSSCFTKNNLGSEIRI